LTAIMGRLVKGVAGGAMLLWKENAWQASKNGALRKTADEWAQRLKDAEAGFSTKMAKAQRDHELKTRSLQNGIRSDKQMAAMKQLHLVFKRLISGANGVAVSTWRLNANLGLETEGHLERLREQRALFSSEIRDTHKSLHGQRKRERFDHGLAQMRQVMLRWKNRELFVRVELWRTCMTDELWAQELYDTQFVLESQNRQNRQSAAMTQFRIVMARQSKGEMGVRFVMWAAKNREYRKAVELLQQRSELSGSHAEDKKGAAMKLLKMALLRLWKGEVAVRVHFWRGARLAQKRRNELMSKRAFEHRMAKGGSLPQLSQVFTMLQQLTGDKLVIQEVFVCLKSLTDELKDAQQSSKVAQQLSGVLKAENSALITSIASEGSKLFDKKTRTMKVKWKLGNLPIECNLALLDHCGARGRRLLAVSSKILQGAVLVARATNRNRETVYVLGEEPGDPSAPMFFEAYKHANEQWVVLPSPGPRLGAAIGMLGQQAYVSGGAEESLGQKHSASRNVSTFEVSGGRWVPGNPMREHRSCHAMAVLDDRLYSVGGCGVEEIGADFLNSAEVLVAGGAWEALPPMASKRAEHAAVGFQGKVWVIGGFTTKSGELRDVEAYDPQSRTWSACPSLSFPRRGCAATVARVAQAGGDECIVVTGGYADSVEYFSPSAGAWQQLAKMNVARGFGGLISFDGFVVAVGGIKDADGDGKFDDLTTTDTERMAVTPLTKATGQTPSWENMQKWGNFGRCSAILG